MTRSAIDPTTSGVQEATVSASQISQIASEMFDAMLHTSVTSIEHVPSLESLNLQATVVLSGEYSASVYVNVDPEMAGMIASKMFGMETADLAVEEIHDALSEVANVIGGNIKGTIELETELSLPSICEQVAELKDCKVGCHFESEGKHMLVRLH